MLVNGLWSQLMTRLTDDPPQGNSEQEIANIGVSNTVRQTTFGLLSTPAIHPGH
jgi:hypothetical protein